MWSQAIVKEACRRFQGNEGSLKPIGGTCKHVFEYERKGEIYILKLYPVAVKDQKILQLEMDWMSFLREKGLKIPKPITSRNGYLIECIPVLPIPFCAISFEKAQGSKVNIRKSIFGNSHFFRLYGQSLGQLHFLSRRFPKEYTLLDQWNEGEIYHRDFSMVDDALLKKWNIYLEQVYHLDKGKDSYGLIHNDLHLNNFLFTEKKDFILYDFSKIKYHWYTYDIALTIFDIITQYQPENKQQFIEHCLLAFMEGYLAESSLDDGWEEQIQFFLEFHELFSSINKIVR